MNIFLRMLMTEKLRKGVLIASSLNLKTGKS